MGCATKNIMMVSQANKRENAAFKAIDFGLSVFFRPGERFLEIVEVLIIWHQRF